MWLQDHVDVVNSTPMQKNSKDFEFKRGIQNPPRVLARENTAEHKKISTVDVTFLPK